MQDAKALEAVGASGVVLECVPSELASRVTEILAIPTIGIGAGAATDAQVLVWQDLLGLTSGPTPKFVARYADMRSTMANAVSEWAADVRTGAYPGPEHSYS
jgi:3-methyl-2-oxobutanoate hydroxymethyltransferase